MNMQLIVKENQTYNVGGFTAHRNDCPINGPQQLLHNDLHMPLGWTLRETNANVNIQHRDGRTQ